MPCSPPLATTSASCCAGWRGFYAPCSKRSSQHSRAPNRPKTTAQLFFTDDLLLLPGCGRQPHQHDREINSYCSEAAYSMENGEASRQRVDQLFPKRACQVRSKYNSHGEMIAAYGETRS